MEKRKKIVRKVDILDSFLGQISFPLTGLVDGRLRFHLSGLQRLFLQNRDSIPVVRHCVSKSIVYFFGKLYSRELSSEFVLPGKLCTPVVVSQRWLWKKSWIFRKNGAARSKSPLRWPRPCQAVPHRGLPYSHRCHHGIQRFLLLQRFN